jgi:hypothetical protein
VERNEDAQRNQDPEQKDRARSDSTGTGDQADPVPPGGHDPGALEEAERKMRIHEAHD